MSEGLKAASAAVVIKKGNKADEFLTLSSVKNRTVSLSSVRDTADSTGSETILTHCLFLIVNSRILRNLTFPQIFDKTPKDFYAIKLI